jgi:hypothetical protein
MNQIERIGRMNSRQVVDACREDSPLARTRQLIVEGMAMIDQEADQRNGLDPIEQRRMELALAARVMMLFVAAS